ncbi:alpha-S2-casein-like [Manis pentadactyla]|uniref:alpha-S2-casein-like n=1 Tax=Manis pentadactyla TaxID=143292 RepID=UPI00255C7C7C|nr:alpha-S2-casein-like [Manis pentadactyla]
MEKPIFMTQKPFCWLKLSLPKKDYSFDPAFNVTPLENYSQIKPVPDQKFAVYLQQSFILAALSLALEDLCSKDCPQMRAVDSTGKTKIELTEEEQVYLKQLYKMNQFYQDLSSPQYLQTYNQRQKVRYPRIHIKTNEYHLLPLQGKEYHSSSEESTRISQEESTQVVPEKTELTDEEKTYLKQLVIFY